MTDSKGEVLLAPASTDCVDITSAHATALNFDVNIVVAEGLGLELVFVKLEPCLRSIHLETCELLGVRHVVEIWMYGERRRVMLDGTGTMDNAKSSEGYREKFIPLASQPDGRKGPPETPPLLMLSRPTSTYTSRMRGNN